MEALDETAGARPDEPLDASTRVTVALEGLLAVSAFAGSFGLMSGTLSMGDAEKRLPFGSPVLGGVALAAFVAIPATVAAVGAFRRRRWAREAHLVTGGLLMAWIVVETAFIGPSSALQPIMFVWGAAILGLGGRPFRRPATPAA